MPFINVRIKAPPLSYSQRRRLQQGATEALAHILRKDLGRIGFLLQQEEAYAWSVGGEEVAIGAHLDATIMTGTNTSEEKAKFLEACYALLREVLGSELPVVTFVVIHETPADAWGFGGQTGSHRLQHDDYPLAGKSVETHQTVQTRFVEAGGIRFAYRRFGKPGGTPLLFFMHFTGTMDHWDPLVTDGLARSREVILFNNAGVSSSTGEVPTTIEGMASDAATFIEALGLSQVDVLGFSIGGTVAQELTASFPALVRRLVLVGTGPRSGEGMATLTPEAVEIFSKTYEQPDDLWGSVMFKQTPTSQLAARDYLQRFRLRAENRDPEVSERVAPAQIEALGKWGAASVDPYAYLRSIKQPTLVINGSDDVIIYTVNSYILQQNLPDATLILYPDSNHGSLYQFHAEFVEDVAKFLDR
jgi:pimeloyl-ACP methyl ester carboxylesterase/phenylpyruvate tautomerase PptA (4-oxalocrotonate tautomerase family)